MYSKFWWLPIIIMFAGLIAAVIITEILGVHAEFSQFFYFSLLTCFIASLIITERKGPGIIGWKLIPKEELDMKKEKMKKNLLRVAGAILTLLIIFSFFLLLRAISVLLGS